MKNLENKILSIVFPYQYKIPEEHLKQCLVLDDCVNKCKYKLKTKEYYRYIRNEIYKYIYNHSDLYCCVVELNHKERGLYDEVIDRYIHRLRKFYGISYRYIVIKPKEN